MRLTLLFLLFSLSSLPAFAQALSPSDKKLIEAARSRYYSLPLSGSSSMQCSVNFDLSTVPLVPSDNADPKRKLIEATRFTIFIDIRGRASVNHSYPVSSTDGERQSVAQITDLQTSLVSGVFQTEYVPSAKGLVLAGNRAVDTTQGSRVDVSYEMGSSEINGLTVPSSMRLKVNKNIDVKFALDGCKVEKGIVLNVAPPPS
jgi:hypothetical protein